MPNRLAHETSPYLLQHAHNPVDWYPWGAEALEKAKTENKPILLSVGYAACHWCHVMAHESFEDETTAALMNEHFVNIKVDREERPDLDGIYMNAVVAMTGQGGWPMTVAMTPEGEPFFGGTYYPPTPRQGMPAFRQVLMSLAQAWEKQNSQLRQSATDIAEHLSQAAMLEGQEGQLTAAALDRAFEGISKVFDEKQGGFGPAPKFPQPMTIEFLLRYHQRTGDKQALHMAEYTLKRMAYGGMYDQVGGGFARYSTDNIWMVPHFEKMLYDNAQLARVYLHAWQMTGKPLYRRIVEETLDYVLREMTHKDGGFYSSQDADSEGEEGKFYVWTVAEIQHNLVEHEADLFIQSYDVRETGNWEGRNILHLPRDPEEIAHDRRFSPEEWHRRMATARQKLYQVRSERVWPARDEKILTAWNGLMLATFAEAGRMFDRDDYLHAAASSAEFLYNTLRTPDGRLLRAWKEGAAAKGNGFLEDYAYLAEGLLALYQTTFDTHWFAWALELVELIMLHFHDVENGGFYDTSDDHEQLIHRPKDVQDNATPSGNAMAVHALLKLSLYTGRMGYWKIAEQATSAVYGAMLKYPTGFGQWLSAAAFILGEPQELAIIGEPGTFETDALLKVVNKGYRPHLVVAVGDETDGKKVELLKARPQLNNQATAYLCRRFVCQQPVTSTDALTEQLANAHKEKKSTARKPAVWG
ncbi:MAG: thioredoxin domain-containing protein [Chloroflexi bacterium]|nr:thioredoxin domain-containing protein [Chloroflexota bacterium]MBP8058701.1 thioredoxin domain-containing protein [Chloroflexota bacterium]